jgi:membrane protein DedA with SNARE-associated domain
MQRRGWIALLLASSVPNPLFDLIGIAAGTLKYPVWRFLAAVWVGKLIKSTTVVYACFYGIEWAVRIIGLD